MANHYFKDRDSYFKFVDETHEVVCVTTNFTNKCIAISFTEADGYEQMKAAYTDTAGEILLYHHLILHHHIQVHQNQYHKLLVNPFGKKRKQK